ncbi:PKD domain-containing protein [Archangium gephyra]|uniref:PKD domain-containing protein n=1 Tax=Archangium gephyra TaxID=48 RepID=UPI003B7A9476
MKRCVAILVGLFLLTPLEAVSFAAGKEVAFGGVELLDGPVTASCDDDGVLDTGESARVRVTLRNSGTERLKLTSMTLSSTDPDVSFPKGAKVYFPPADPSQSVSAELPVALSGAATPRDISLTIAYRDDEQTAPGDKTHTATYRVNTDELQGTLETVESARHPWTVTLPPVGSTSWTRVAEGTGANNFFRGPNNGVTTDLSLVSPPLQVSATEAFRVIFQHRYAFEASPAGFYYDGAVIELSQDGTTWADIGASVSPTYNATIDAGGDNPLKSRRAYGGQSPGYPAFTKATLSLGTTYAGKTVRLRFRIGTDASTGATGWDLDDLQLEGVVNTPFTTLVAHRGECVNRVPVAEAGPDQAVDEASLVTLSGSGTDPEGAPLTYAWTQSKGPSVTFSDPSASSPTFLAPDVTGDTDLQFELRVSDGVKTSAPDVVTVRVRNLSLEARAGEDQVVREGSGVTLNGSESRAAEGAELTYTWTQEEGPPVNLMLSGPRAMFNAPEVDEETVLTFRLRVEAGGKSGEDTVTVRVIDRNVTPQPGEGGCAAGPDGGVPTTAFLMLAVLGFTLHRRSRRSHEGASGSRMLPLPLGEGGG